MEFRNLEKVRFIIKEATMLDVMYAYEDLVFPEHGAFLIQFDDSKEKNLFCYFHEDCNAENAASIFRGLSETAKKEKFTIEKKQSFTMEQKGEDVEIKFQ